MVIKDSTSKMENKELLEFYKAKYHEQDKKHEKYREKVDKHMKELIADRQELVDEIMKKDEQISSFRKALLYVQILCTKENEKFLDVLAENDLLKKNEEILHDRIRQLLHITKDKDLRDQIIYTLKDPEIKIAFNYNQSRKVDLLSDNTRSDALKEKMQSLKSELEMYGQLSKNTSNIVLEDCKKALEASKNRIEEDSRTIRQLSDKLGEIETYFNESGEVFSSEINKMKKDVHRDAAKKSHSANLMKISSNFTNAPADDETQRLPSVLKDVHLSLSLLSKRIGEVLSSIGNIQSSDIFKLASLLPIELIEKDSYVPESVIEELHCCIRQCTRLSYDANYSVKSLHKSQESNVEAEINTLTLVLEELAALTADTEILFISLARASFFKFLTKPAQPFEKFGVKATSNRTQYISEVDKMEANTKSAQDIVTRAMKLTVLLMQKCQRLESYKIRSKKSAESQSLYSEKQLASNVAEVEEVTEATHSISPHWQNSRTEGAVRTIDTVLAKISQLERGEYTKDVEMCQHLSEEINNLSDQLKTLYVDYNDSKRHDDFAKYSSDMMAKLEALADHSRDAVSSAQIRIHNQKTYLEKSSQRLIDTQELLRLSVNECLTLKDQLRKLEEQQMKDKVNFTRQLKEKLHKATDFRDLETAVKEVMTSVDSGSESGERSPTPYECFYCKQGSTHKLCEKTIHDLKENVRKLNTELKMVSSEIKEEKKISKMCQQQVEQTATHFEKETRDLSLELEKLQLRNKSLLEQLNLEKNRLKNMERYRRLQIEGFENDVKILKSNIKELQKQLMKSVLIFEQTKKDEELLQAIHMTAHQSLQSANAIKRLKAKLYEIETDIKHI